MSYVMSRSRVGNPAKFKSAQRATAHITVSLEVRAYVNKNSKLGETLDDTVRRLMGLPAREQIKPK